MRRAVTEHTDAPGAVEGLLHALLDGSRVFGSYWDRDGRNVLAGNAYREWLGLDLERVRGVHISEVVGPARYAEIEPIIAAVLTDGAAQFDESPLVDVSGRTRHVREAYVPDVADGEVRGFSLLVTDVTERVEATEANAVAAVELANADALQHVAEFVAARTQPAEVAAFVSREVAHLFGADAGGIVRFRADALGEVVGWHSDVAQAALEVGTTVDLEGLHAVSIVYRTGTAARRRPRKGASVLLPALTERVAVPIRVGDRVWGALMIASVKPDTIARTAAARLARFAELVALGISERDARDELQWRVAQQVAVNELSVLALGGGGVEDLLRAAIDKVAEIVGVPTASIVEVLPDGDAMVRAVGGTGASTHVGMRYAASPGTLTGTVLTDGVSIVTADLRGDARFLRAPAAGEGMTAGAGFVIRLADRAWGVVFAFSPEPRSFTADELAFLESVAKVIGRAIERSESEQTIHHQALHDALTGIPNRTLLLDRLTLALERAIRTGTFVGVLYIDLDRFKDVNDTYGHPEGDALLVAVAEHLTAAIRPGDTVARVGGDEFAVVAETLAGPEEALALAERLLRELATPLGTLTGASIGVAVRKGGASADDAMRDADTALYRAKASGRGRVELFDAEMRARMLDRLQTEADLRGALEREEFDLHYQPIVALADGSIAALEGLVRWRHPTRGMLPPGVFIGIAEETGAIIDLGRFVIARACADAARWNATRPDADPVLMTVNLSPVQLGDAGLPEFVATSLSASGIEPSQLGLEITETVVFSENPEHAARLLAIKRLGVRLLLDDYGTGYSSLSYIRRFPLDFLKLDRSFVSGVGQDETDTAIVVAVCELARALGLTVVAEGVESAEQLAALHAIGCEHVQGYYFARPLTRAKVDHLLEAEPPWNVDGRCALLRPAV
jgi:diguanylate cyclase (GGDEF)-like protein/PAS domain S-box-containing protein